MANYRDLSVYEHDSGQLHKTHEMSHVTRHLPLVP